MTTANQLEFTKKAFESLKKTKEYPSMDIFLIDDASDDDTVNYCLENNMNHITKDYPRGLIDSWNIAYQQFKKGNYDYIIYANNDILVPSGAVQNILDMAKSHVVVGALSTLKGVGHQPLQALENNYTVTGATIELSLGLMEAKPRL